MNAMRLFGKKEKKNEQRKKQIKSPPVQAKQILAWFGCKIKQLKLGPTGKSFSAMNPRRQPRSAFSYAFSYKVNRDVWK